MPIRRTSDGARSQVRAALLSCIVTAAALSICGATSATQAGLPDDPDALYAMREDWASATRAADLWEQHVSTSYEAAWKLARDCYWLSSHGPADGRRRHLERVAVAVVAKQAGHALAERQRDAIRVVDEEPQGAAGNDLREQHLDLRRGHV